MVAIRAALRRVGLTYFAGYRSPVGAFELVTTACNRAGIGIRFGWLGSSPSRSASVLCIRQRNLERPRLRPPGRDCGHATSGLDAGQLVIGEAELAHYRLMRQSNAEC